MVPEKKNPIAAMIVAQMAKKKPTHEDTAMEADAESEEMEESDDYSIMASDILSAIESKDPEMLAASLKSFVSSCKGGE